MTRPEPYNGAVRTNGDGGWTPVDTLTDTTRCELCEGAGWTEHIDPTGARTTPRCDCGDGRIPVAAPWAYPQPGDHVLVQNLFTGIMLGPDHIEPSIWWVTSEPLRHLAYPIEDLRLIVDQPNDRRIPGTQPLEDI